MISLRVFKGYIQNGKRQIPQYLLFRCGMAHLYFSLKKWGKTSKLQKEILKTEMNHDEVDGKNYRDKKTKDWIMSRMMCCVLLFHMLGMLRLWKKLQDLAWKTVCHYLD